MAKKTFIAFGTGNYQAEKPRLPQDVDLDDVVHDKAESLGLVFDIADNYADDAAAATGGIAIGGFYHNAGDVKIRLV